MVKYICGKVGAVPKVMSATLNVVVSINSTTVMQTYWTALLLNCCSSLHYGTA